MKNNQSEQTLTPDLTVFTNYMLVAGVYCVSFSCMFYFVAENIFLATIHAAALFIVIVNYLILVRTKNFKRAVSIMLSTGCAVVLSLFATGGWDNTGFLWSFAYLPFALFLSDGKATLKWVAVLFFGSALLVFTDRTHVIGIPYSPVALFNYFASLLTCIICIFVFREKTIKHEKHISSIQNEELLRREKRFRALLENSHETITVSDEHHKPIYRSPSAYRTTGWTTEERLTSGNATEQIHPGDREKIKCVMQEVMANPGQPAHVCFRLKHREGHYIWMEGVITNMLHDENIRGIISNLRDISERKKFEEKQALYESIVNSSEDAIISKTLEEYVTSWNRGAENMFGYAAEEIMGKFISGSDHLKIFKDEQEILAQIKRGESVEHYEAKRATKHGKIVSVSMSVSPIKNSEGAITGISKIIRDITKQKEAEEKINKLNEELRELFDHLQKSREDERKYIAREIHDELGQALTALKIDVSMMKRKMISGGEQCPKYIEEEFSSIIRKIDLSIESVKKIATDLRPEILDHLDIIDAIKWQAQQFENITGIKCSVSHLPDHLNLESLFSTTVYRTVQEALTNITRHAGATMVRIAVELDSKKLLLEINDNGRGIKDEDIQNIKSLGLIGMRERIQLVNGTMSISGKPSKGTTVAVKIPIQ